MTTVGEQNSSKNASGKKLVTTSTPVRCICGWGIG
jgi:hypothetical protein